MHILVIPSWYAALDRGGTGRFFRDQALALKDAGATVGVIAPMGGTQPSLSGNAADPVIPTLTKNFKAFGPRWPGRNEWFFVRAGLRLFQDYVDRFGVPDVVHAHCCWPAGMLADKIRRRHSIPFVVTEHRTDFVEGRVRPWLRKATDLVLTHSTRRIVVSPQLGNLMAAQFPLSMRNWNFVPNVLSSTFLSAAPAPPPGGDTFTFVQVGAMTPRKNQEGVVRAFAAAFGDVPSVRLVLIGDGPDAPKIRDTAQRLGLASRVELRGSLAIDDVRAVMERSHALVLASTAETFGVVLIEALACGLPLIATDCGGPAAIVSRDNGLLIPTGDDEALVSALKDMKANYARYDRTAIRDAAIRRYSPATVGKELLALIKS